MRKEQSMLGILAYGSLVKNPGKELEKQIIERRMVETPFDVEYARKSTTRSDAPTLVRVPSGKGKPVKAYVLVLNPRIEKVEAKNMLYRREINKVKSKEVYDDKEQREKKNAVAIDEWQNLAGVPVVLCTSLKPNINSILRDDIPPMEKA